MIEARPLPATAARATTISRALRVLQGRARILRGGRRATKGQGHGAQLAEPLQWLR